MALEPEQTGRPFFKVLERRQLVAVTTAVIGILLVAVMVSFVKPKYGAIAHVLLLNDTTGRDPATVSSDMPTLATGTVVLGFVKRELNLPQALDDFQKQVSAHVSPRSTIMTIAYRDRDPARAITVANAVADEFVRFYGTLPRSRSASELQQISRDLAIDRSKLLALDRELEIASSGQSYVGTQASLDNIAGHLGELREQRALAFSQEVADRTDLEQNSSTDPQQAKIVRHEILQNSSAFKALQANVSADMSAYASLQAGVTDNFPGLAGARDKVVREQAMLAQARQTALHGADAYSPSLGGQIVEAQRARAALAGDASRVATIDEQINALRLEVGKSGSSHASIAAVRSMRDAAEADYEALALRYTNAQGLAAESNTLGEATVVDRAVAAEPNLLGPNMLLVIGTVLALICAVVAAYLAEMLDPRLIASDDVESLYGRPTLATLRHR